MENKFSNPVSDDLIRNVRSLCATVNKNTILSLEPGAALDGDKLCGPHGVINGERAHLHE